MRKVLDTSLIKINKIDDKLQVLISCANGQVLEHASFNDDLRGLIGALTLAIDVTAGKFYPQGIFTPKKESEVLKLGTTKWN
jgi:hypothetical protein